MSEQISNEDKQASEKTWNASAYDTRHSFVWKYGEEVLELLAPKPDERVLDLGCGTGHLTNQIAARGAQVVELRFFGGLSIPEVAEALGTSPATVKRDWQFAKGWLARELRAEFNSAP